MERVGQQSVSARLLSKEKSMPARPLGLSKPEPSFEEVLAKTRKTTIFDQLAESWKITEARVGTELAKAPASIRGLIKLQLSVHALHLQSEILSRVGESVSNTVKRVQQMGTGS